MFWFLRLFRAYRDLEAELSQCAAARIEAEDRVREWRAHYDDTRQERDAAMVRVLELERWKEEYATRDIAGEQQQSQPMRRTARELQQEANQAARRAAMESRRKLMSTVPEE